MRSLVVVAAVAAAVPVSGGGSPVGAVGCAVRLRAHLNRHLRRHHVVVRAHRAVGGGVRGVRRRRASPPPRSAAAAGAVLAEVVGELHLGVGLLGARRWLVARGLAVDVAVRVRGLLRVSLRRIRARPRRSGKPKPKVATHAAGARAEVSKLKPEPAVHTHAAAALLADGEVAHRVGGRVDAALAKPVAKRRGSVRHRSRRRPSGLCPRPTRRSAASARARWAPGRVRRAPGWASGGTYRRETRRGRTAPAGWIRRGVSVGGGDGPRDGLGPRFGHRAARRGRGDLADALLGLSGLRLW